MKKIAIFITTYNRPEMLADLLGDIRKESRGLDIHLVIINDHSPADYRPVEQYLEEHFKGRYRYLVNPVNQGKKNYWKTVDKGYNLIADIRYDYFFQIADDMRLVAGFFRKAMRAWDIISDKRKACLNISVDYSRLMRPFWTSYHPHPVSFGNHEYIRTGWTDLCLVSAGEYLDALNYTVSPVDPRWSGNKELSSGVGMQISRRLIGSGFSIYSLKRSLVISDDHPSVMHPELRKEQKLITNHNMDKITASMATFPGREESLKDVIASIIDQVDELWIYANLYTKPPLNIRSRKLKWFLGDKHLGDLGDAGKFYRCEEIKGYHFTIDDDLIYPRDYVFTLIGAIERYERRCVVSCHGRTFPPGLIKSYYRGAVNRYACLRAVPQDVFAHVIGTGVLSYHTDTVKIPFGIFEASNMADVWFSRYCQTRGIPRLILGHKGGWIKDSEKYDQATSIYQANVNDDRLQTRIMNTVNWTLP